ncbi:hypothetical protein DASC09_001860 [Saccharomycopsis crataegensis]|uniref:Uncharacterized protein n=1 Tax=Saccharomycopsis crataegensis TaxID=43959 RepID=A0AAV5QDY6_9ASCO|nr:hypothetical protein DASC09_001860 [Saccharomycopsis crataegensis]
MFTMPVQAASRKMMVSTTARRALSTSSTSASGIPPHIKYTLVVCIGGAFVAAGAMTKWYYQSSPMKKIFRDPQHNLHHH